MNWKAAITGASATTVRRKLSNRSHRLSPPSCAHVGSDGTAAPRQSCLQICQLSSVTSRQKSATHEFLQRLLCKGAFPGDEKKIRRAVYVLRTRCVRRRGLTPSAAGYRGPGISALLLIYGSANR